MPRGIAPAAALSLLASLSLACAVPLPAPQLTATAEHRPVTTSGSGLNGQPLPTASPVASRSVEASPTPSPATPVPATATVATAAAMATPGPLIREVEAPAGTPAALVTAVAAAQPSTATPQRIAELTGEALAILNDYRRRSGLPPLAANPRLGAAANAHSRLMAEANWFGHQGPDGSSPQGRIIAAGYRGQFKGEAVAGGQSTAQQVINTWLESPAHAAILLEPSSVEVGVGYYFHTAGTYGHYWTLVTGSP